MKIILSESQMTILMGMYFTQLSDKLIDLQPELAVNDYGQSTTLPSLIKDLVDGDLLMDTQKVQITDLGREFLKHNVIQDEEV